VNAAEASKLGITLVGEGDIVATPTPRKLSIEIKDAGNRVTLDEDRIEGRMTIDGRNNVIRCDGHPATRFPVKLFVSIVGNDCEVHLGEGLTTNGLTIIMHGEGRRITIGRDAMLLNEVRIGRGAIVAARSVVMGEVPPSCVVAGAPARIVREGVSWTRQLAPTASQVDAMLGMPEDK